MIGTPSPPTPPAISIAATPIAVVAIAGTTIIGPARPITLALSHRRTGRETRDGTHRSGAVAPILGLGRQASRPKRKARDARAQQNCTNIHEYLSKVNACTAAVLSNQRRERIVQRLKRALLE
jgi:hypothetical protein